MTLNTLSRASLSRASRQLVHLNNHVRPSSSSSSLAAVGFPTSSSTKMTTTRQQPPAAPAIRFFSTTSSKEDALHLAQSQATPEAAVQKGFFGKIADRLSIKGQQRRIILGEELFQAAFRQSNDPRWYGPGRIPRTFRSRHAMVTMHLWFLHKRLIAANVPNGPLLGDHDTALRVQEELFEIFWNDTLCRIRAEGVREMSVTKSLLQVQQFTFLHLFHYDHIYQHLASSQSHLDHPKDASAPGEEEDGDASTESFPAAPATPPPIMEGADQGDVEEIDPLSVLDPSLDLRKVENRITELKKLIWMHIMVRDPQAKESDDHLTRLAWYIEAQYQNILVDWPGQYVSEARVAWVEPPDFHRLETNKGKVLPDIPIHTDDLLPEPWLTNITLRGATYYWNPKTGQSQWERPSWNQEDKEAA